MHKSLNEKLEALDRQKAESRKAWAKKRTPTPDTAPAAPPPPKKRSKSKAFALVVTAVLSCAGVPAGVIAALHAAGLI